MTRDASPPKKRQNDLLLLPDLTQNSPTLIEAKLTGYAKLVGIGEYKITYRYCNALQNVEDVIRKGPGNRLYIDEKELEDYISTWYEER